MVVNPRSSAAAVQRAKDPYYIEKGTQSALNKAVATPPVNSPRDAAGRVAAQDAARLETIANTPTGSNLEKAVFDPEGNIVRDSTGAAVTINYGKVSQAELQNIVKNSLNERLASEKQKLDQGAITQEEFDATNADITGRIGAADRVLSMTGFSSFQDLESARKTALEGLEAKRTDIQTKLNNLGNEYNDSRVQDERKRLYAELQGLPSISELNSSYSDVASKLEQHYKDQKTAEVNAPVIRANANPDTLLRDENGNLVTKLPAGSPQDTFNQRNVATVPTTTTAAIQSMIASSDPATASTLQTALGILGQRMQDIGTEYYNESDRAKAEFDMFGEIIGEMSQRNDELSSMKMNLLKQTQAESEKLAELQKQSDLAANETARQQKQLDLQQARMDLAKANSKKVLSMISRNAVLGGFGSMASIAEIERTDFEGAQAIASFTAQMAIVDKSYGDKALEIGANYTNTMVTIHQNYANSMIDVVSKYNDKIDEITKLKIGGAQRMEDKISTARTTMRNSWIKTQDDTLKLMQDANKEARDQANKLRDEALAKQRDTFTQAMKIADTYGTKNPELFSAFEETLGLPAGTFSNTKTLEELRMKSANGVIGGSGVAKLVDEQRAQIRQMYPTANGKLIDTLVYSTLQKLLPQKNLLTAYSYMQSSPIGGELYRIQPYLTASQGENAIGSVTAQLEDQRSLQSGEKSVEELVNELQDGKKMTDSKGNPAPMTDDQVKSYMQDMDYTYVDEGSFWDFDSWFKPLGEKFVSNELPPKITK
jgi:hypothetical protein